MVKFMKRGRVVIVTQGRMAGCKAVVLESKEPTRKHKFQHCIVAGISKPPRRINKGMNRSQIAKKSEMHTFLRVVNQTHLMPTRYKLNLKTKVNMSVKELHPKDGKRRELRNGIRRQFKRIYFKNAKPSTRWFFKKLYF
mmetsp:Transcript_48475/g.77565  ORF Transcript_48475/g.77565 Transcript_48475/m.77565 type:complete len:139 (+) Transcript_48475:128-544(+)